MNSNGIVINNDDIIEFYYYDVECNFINNGKFLIIKSDGYLMNSTYFN